MWRRLLIVVCVGAIAPYAAGISPWSVASAGELSDILKLLPGSEFRYSRFLHGGPNGPIRILQFDDPKYGPWHEALADPEELRKRSGLAPNTLISLFEIGEAPFQIWVVRTKTGATVDVEKTLADRGFARSEVSGTTVMARGADFKVDFLNSDVFDPFGGNLGSGSRIAILPDRLVESRGWPPIREALPAVVGKSLTGRFATQQARLTGEINERMALLTEAVFGDDGQLASALGHISLMVPAGLPPGLNDYQKGRLVGDSLARANMDGVAACKLLRSALGQPMPPVEFVPQFTGSMLAVGRSAELATLVVAINFRTRAAADLAVAVISARLTRVLDKLLPNLPVRIEGQVSDSKDGTGVVLVVAKVANSQLRFIEIIDIITKGGFDHIAGAISPCS